MSKNNSSTRNNLLQPIGSLVGNPICEYAISQGYVRNKVDLVPLACEN